MLTLNAIAAADLPTQEDMAPTATILTRSPGIFRFQDQEG